MAPYLIIGDDTNGNLYSVNWWANAKTTSSSNYYNKDIVDNVVKITILVLVIVIIGGGVIDKCEN